MPTVQNVLDAGAASSPSSTRDQVTLEGALSDLLSSSEQAYVDDLLASGKSADTIAYLVARARVSHPKTG